MKKRIDNMLNIILNRKVSTDGEHMHYHNNDVNGDGIINVLDIVSLINSNNFRKPNTRR